MGHAAAVSSALSPGRIRGRPGSLRDPRTRVHGLPFVRSFDAAVHAAFAVTLALIVALLLHDRRMGQPVPPYRALLALTIVQYVGFALIGEAAGLDCVLPLARWRVRLMQRRYL